MKERIGIIDIGSNTIRLVIFERLTSRQYFEEIENIKVSARLRFYFDETQSLNQAGIELLTRTLLDFHTMLQHYMVTDITCVATASIRQAVNKAYILRVVQERTKITIKLLDEYEEAYYGFLAVIHSITIQEGITIDIGGGSTEVTYFHNRELRHYHSFPFGALSLKLQFVQGDIPTDQERENIRKYINGQFDTLPWIANKNVPVIALGGSARNVGKLHQQFTNYPLDRMHQYEMDVLDIEDLKEKLLPFSFIELQKMEGLARDRADTILPAFEVFDSLCFYAGATKFIISRKGLRDGILYEKWTRNHDSFLPLIDTSLNEFKENFYIGGQDDLQITRIATIFFEAVQRIAGFGDCFSEDDYRLLKLGARIYNLGKKANSESSNATFSLLSNRTLVGISHRDQLKLALIASFKGKGSFQNYIQPFKDWYSKEEQVKLCTLGAILKVSQSLNASNQNTVLDLQITHENKGLWNIFIKCKGYYRIEEYHFEKQKRHLEKILKLTFIPYFQIEEERGV